MSYEAVKRWRAAHPQKTREYNRRYYERHRKSNKPYKPQGAVYSHKGELIRNRRKEGPWDPHRLISDEEFEDNLLSITMHYSKVLGSAGKRIFHAFYGDWRLVGVIKLYEDHIDKSE